MAALGRVCPVHPTAPTSRKALLDEANYGFKFYCSYEAVVRKRTHWHTYALKTAVSFCLVLWESTCRSLVLQNANLVGTLSSAVNPVFNSLTSLLYVCVVGRLEGHDFCLGNGCSCGP